MDINKHKFYMIQILRDIFSDAELKNLLGFKGGTALMFFYQLPRFSVDLDFNLLDATKEQLVFDRLQSLALKYGKIEDAAIKYYGPLVVLNYASGDRNLKIEVSNRQYTTTTRYELKNLLGVPIRVMCVEDMFAHKLCALLDRSETTNRDIFDVWFFIKRGTSIHASMVEERMQMPLSEYLERCAQHLETLSDKTMHVGLGELIDPSMRQFIHDQLRTETITQLRLFAMCPLVTDPNKSRD